MTNTKDMEDTPEIKRMDLNEFVELGLLQELNRRFLHPMGLALEVVVDDDDNVTSFGRVWDYRDDPEGMLFGSFSETSVKKKETVDLMFEEKRKEREEKFGYHIQPVEIDKEGEKDDS